MQVNRTRRLRQLALIPLLATLGGGLLSACAPLMVGGMVGTAMVATDRRTSGTQVEDQGIELKAGKRLADKLGDRVHISVNSYNRQVLLTGETRTEEDKAEAERIVAEVENVGRVVNEVQVGFISSLSSRSNDVLVAGKIKASLVDARDLISNAFYVVVERGEVFMLGRVTEREAHRATEIARGVSGVKKVVRLFEIISEEELARTAPKPPKPSESR
ncbi:BON domain-containing protein [Pelomonas sp. APW6]|uniref:BON domain-containing protein n=1 Tax=Roseateles subflavus TaxID=3053353 RepID=A0ABT7LK30_9BURK|nr:BON domain-containing protein [Pelomonas sp. APW6]MDL5032622.1 BON domain-containing protein [Pelomonas sp. APW6]